MAKKIPEYLRRLLEWKARFLKAQREEGERAAAEAKRKNREEQDRIKALRRPPAKVWRIGRTILWLPPETADQLEPDGYWISERRNGEWTAHGDYLPKDTRSAQLYGDGPAQVEAYYHDTALGETYISPAVTAPEQGKDRFLVDHVQYYVSVRGRPPIYYERWRRVLAGFGVAKGKRVRGVLVKPLVPAMTAQEAQGYADRGWGRWVPVARALRRIEATRTE